MTNPVPVAVGCLVRNNKLLLIKRNKPPFENMWSIPAGKVEYGEYLDETIEREFKEEANLDVAYDGVKATVTEHIFEGGKLSLHTIMFLCNLSANGAEPRSGSSGELKWFDLSSIENFKDKIIPSDYEMIQKFVLTNEDGYFNSIIEKINGSYTLRDFRKI